MFESVFDYLTLFYQEQVATRVFTGNVISGLVSSLIFLFVVLVLFRPRIKIAPVISYTSLHSSQTPPTSYHYIKFVNHSLFSAFDLQIELSKLKVKPASNGMTNTIISSLKLQKSKYDYVPPFRPQLWKKGYSAFALQAKAEDNLAIILADDSTTVEVRIVCRHALTGLGKVFTREYVATDIKAGRFVSGNTFAVE